MLRKNSLLFWMAAILYGAALVSPSLSRADLVQDSGQVEGWLEKSTVMEFMDGAGIEAWWSIADSESGWFYGFNDNTSVTYVTGVDNISALSDVTGYDYRSWYAGPVHEGDIVLFNNAMTGYYAALYVQAIRGAGVTGGAYLDGAWYANNTGNFAQPVPAPGALMLLAGGLMGVLGLKTKNHRRPPGRSLQTPRNHLKLFKTAVAGLVWLMAAGAGVTLPAADAMAEVVATSISPGAGAIVNRLPLDLVVLNVDDPVFFPDPPFYCFEVYFSDAGGGIDPGNDPLMTFNAEPLPEQHSDQPIQSTSWTVPSEVLIPGQSYWWWARACGQCVGEGCSHCGPWTVPVRFQVGPEPLAGELALSGVARSNYSGDQHFSAVSGATDLEMIIPSGTRFFTSADPSVEREYIHVSVNRVTDQALTPPAGRQYLGDVFFLEPEDCSFSGPGVILRLPVPSSATAAGEIELWRYEPSSGWEGPVPYTLADGGLVAEARVNHFSYCALVTDEATINPGGGSPTPSTGGSADGGSGGCFISLLGDWGARRVR